MQNLAWQMNQNLEIEKMACNFDFVFSQNYVPRYGGTAFQWGGQTAKFWWVGGNAPPPVPPPGKTPEVGAKYAIILVGVGALQNWGGHNRRGALIQGCHAQRSLKISLFWRKIWKASLFSYEIAWIAWWFSSVSSLLMCKPRRLPYKLHNYYCLCENASYASLHSFHKFVISFKALMLGAIRRTSSE